MSIDRLYIRGKTFYDSLPFYLCQGFLSDCSYDSKKDFAKTTCPIFMKIGGKVKHRPRKKPMNFGADPTHRATRRIRFLSH